ncbi:MAG: hypothetical protein V4477_16895 [Pseudomonadota bacterium]
MATRQKRCELYRHFSATGELLYVGIAWSALERLMTGHRTSSRWFDQIARIEIERFPSREAALSAEKAAIRDELPAFNVSTDTKHGIKCRSEEVKREIESLRVKIEAAGYPTRANACLSVMQAAWRSIEAGKEPEKYYLRALPFRRPAVNHE